MARQFKTGLVITGDAKSGIRAIRATESELAKLDRHSRRNTRTVSQMTRSYDNTAAQIRGAQTALTVTVGAIAAMTTRTLAKQDRVGKLAQQIGVSTEALSELQFAAEQTGAGSDKLSAGLEVMSKRLSEVA